jgi:hypothetical protein
MNEKQLAKLVKQTAARAAAKAAKARRVKDYDATLQHKPEHDNAAEERSQFFDEMKRREF